MKALKLQIDLVPADVWGRSLRKQIRRSTWDKIRKEVVAKAGGKCDICASDAKLQCHEVWRYDDKRKIQKLIGFQASCHMCHHVTHYGMSTILARQGLLSLEGVDRHFLRVNGVTADVLKKHKQEAGALFLQRSQMRWRVDFGKWRPLWEDERAIRNTK